VKIVYCIARSDTIGGAHVHVIHMSSWLRSLGYDASVIVGGEGIFCDELSRKKVPYCVCRHLRRPINLFHDAAAFLELRQLIRKLSPNVISLHSAKAGILGRLAAAGSNCAVLFTAHGWSFAEGVPSRKARVYKVLERVTAQLADRIITVSEHDRALALDSGIGRPGQIVTILNAMPDSSARARMDHVSGLTRIVMVARLDEQKDHVTLFAALAKLNDKSWIVELVGDGALEANLRKAADEFEIADRVRFLGFRRDVDEILARSHLFVLASKWEGFPRSIIEAMRAGLPIIASNVGGVSESVIENETGFVVPRGDAELLRSRLAYLLDRPEERARLGAEARRIYEKNFRFDRMALETLSLYQDIVAGVQCADT